MAVYKVAQDVEADDKLLGPFSFRQFIYLIIVAISIGLAWGLGQVFIGLAIIPLPIILFFGVLALPLRKDQPMEVYVAAIISFYIKPRRRIWTPDGINSLVEITAPKVVEVQRTKDITESEAERRLSYLADIADTQGWAVRHAAQPMTNSSMITDAYFEAQQAEDVLDTNGGVSQSLSAMISQSDEQRRQDMVSRMQQAATGQSSAAPIDQIRDPYQSLVEPPSPPPTNQSSDPEPHTRYNPYPEAIRQSVIQPLEAGEQLTNEQSSISPDTKPLRDKNTQQSTTTTSENTIPPDIINLANNSDLSIETIQREANRIQQKADKDDEVFISLH